MADIEKTAQDEQLERISTNHSDPSNKEELEQVQTHDTLAKVDIHNRQAFKGDDSDGKFQWDFRNWLAAGSLAMLYTGIKSPRPILLHLPGTDRYSAGSQILLYFTGAMLEFIAADIDSPNAIGWLPVANTLTIAAICPFVGYLQDLFGKLYIAIFGAVLLCVGCAVMGSTHSLGQALVGMALAGGGAGIGELTGLAGYVWKHCNPTTLTTFV